MTKARNINRPGTISPATAEDAARFMDATMAAWRKYRAEQDAKEKRAKRRKQTQTQLTLF